MTQRRTRRIPRWILALGDLLLINAGVFLAFYVRFGAEFPVENYLPFVQIGPWITVAGLVIFAAMRLYDAVPVDFIDTLRSIVIGVLLLGAATMALTFWARGFAFPRSVLIMGAILQMALLAVWRVVFWYMERMLVGERRVVIVAGGGHAGRGDLRGADQCGGLQGRTGGTAGAAGAGGAAVAQSASEGVGVSRGTSEEVSLILKFLSIPKGWFRVDAVITWCDKAYLEERLGRADAVMIAPSVPTEEKPRLVAAALAQGCEVFVVPDFYDILLMNARVGQVDDLPVVEVPRLGLTPWQRAAKRVLDLVVAVAGLLLAAPLMPVIALLVRASSPGPVFYRQERVGEGGRVFTLYKFRTMVQDAEALSGPVLAAADDPRVTGIGRFLRATRLDELPQLWNVLRGDMSLVGPRPERPHFVEQYSGALPDYGYRHLVKPGLTGFAQIMGRYSTTAADKLRYDLYYIRNYSFFLDLKILLQTLHALVRPESARGLEGPGLEEQAAAEEILRRNRSLRDRGLPLG